MDQYSFTDSGSLPVMARNSVEDKKHLKGKLPFLGIMSIGLVIICGAWISFPADDPPTSVELRSLSHEGSEGLSTETNVVNNVGGRESRAAETMTNEDLFTEEPNDSTTSGFIKTGLPPYYRLGKVIEDWDEQRQIWFENHPSIKNQTEDGRPRLFMLTGSQPERCRTSTGDYLMLRTFKNKVDYCRLHDVGIFYNVAILDKKMDSFWSKLPLVRAAMEAHPEAEWLWWVDADLIITDMEFKIPFEKYESYNLVVPGWDSLIYGNKSVMGLNAGSFLVRNCAWTMKFLDRWASMGPKGPIRDRAGKLQSALMWDRPKDYTGDDQAGLIYFMVKEREVWGEKILLENSYNLNGYWVDLVGGMEEVEAAERKGEAEAEKEVAAEVMGEREVMEVAAERRRRRGAERWRRSFVTHFAGCQPCTGNSNPTFGKGQCLREMQRALAFADNQVLRAFHYRHPGLDTHDVQRLP